MPSDAALPPPPPPRPPLPPPRPVAAPEAGPFVAPRRLHPASVVLGLNLAQIVQAVAFPAVATLAAGRGFTIGLLGVFAVVGLTVRVLAWQRFRFSFDGEVLRVDSGVLSRSHRSLDVARIQQVEIERGVVQRLLGLAALRVETAGSATEPEVDLRVLPEADAVALRTAVRASQERLTGGGTTTVDDGGGEPEDREVLAVPASHVALAAVTGARLLVFPAVVGGALQFAGQFVDQIVDEVFDRLVARGITSPGDLVDGGPQWRFVALLVAVTLLLSVASAVVVGLLRDGNYRLTRVGDDLHVSRGLLSTKDSVVPLRRVQLVEVQRNWLRRLLGYATVRIRSAGGSAGGDGRVTIPLLPEAEVERVLAEVLTGMPGTPPLRSHPPAALRRALFRWLRASLWPIALVWGVLALPFVEPTFADLLRYGVLLVVPVNLVLAVVEYRQLAHGLSDLVVVSRRGALSITTSFAPVVKVQAVSSRRSLFQRRLGLTSSVAHVAGPGARVEVLDADVDDARDLHERLTAHAASPTSDAVALVDPDDAPGSSDVDDRSWTDGTHDTP